jgi:signal transduction histidine kinase
VRGVRSIRLTTDRRELLLAAALTVAVELELVLSRRADTAGQVAVALLMTVPLAFRLRFPVEVLAAVVVGAVALAGLGGRPFAGPSFPVVAVLLAVYAVGSRTSGVRFALGAGLAWVGLFTALRLRGADIATSLVVPSLVTGCGLVIGRALGVLRFESDVFDARASELERERDERAQAAVAEERRRIARELHDVIGHSISVMGVQAGAVRSVLREDQPREREALLAVERTGRQAVGEMRRLIGLLRSEDDEADDPAPSLLRAGQLVDELRDAGLSAVFTVHGDLRVLSPGVDLAGFRIVQEALTNVMKHAPGASVTANVTCTEHELAIEVIDDGDGTPPRSAGHQGHGLVGMHERVVLYGGELVSGPRPAGGFAIHARIPLEIP